MNNSIKKSLGSPYGLRRWQSGAIMLLLLLVVGCGSVKTVPITTNTQVHYVDSVRYEIRDSIRIIERSRWKDYGGLLDTLRIRGNRSEMKAWTDTTNNILNGSLEEDPQEEKQRIIYRDRWKTKDSLVFQDRPVPYEVTKEVKIIPKFWIITGVFGIICMVLLLTFIGLKIYRFFKGRNILK